MLLRSALPLKGLNRHREVGEDSDCCCPKQTPTRNIYKSDDDNYDDDDDNNGDYGEVH